MFADFSRFFCRCCREVVFETLADFLPMPTFSTLLNISWLSSCVLNFYISINHICLKTFFFLALGSKFKVSSFILSIYKMSKALDPFWEWGTPVDQLNRQILTCNQCGKRMTSGISRLKYHLAQKNRA